VAETTRPTRGLLDTSVVLDLEHIPASRLRVEVAVSALTMAELAAGPHAARTAEERARRQDRLQRAEAAFDSLSFDGETARGRVYPAVAGSGRKAGGPRAVDLLIAATALAAAMPLCTHNTKDFKVLDGLNRGRGGVRVEDPGAEVQFRRP
jgi:predicted nucleic acid-binding protein